MESRTKSRWELFASLVVGGGCLGALAVLAGLLILGALTLGICRSPPPVAQPGTENESESQEKLVTLECPDPIIIDREKRSEFRVKIARNQCKDPLYIKVQQVTVPDPKGGEGKWGGPATLNVWGKNLYDPVADIDPTQKEVVFPAFRFPEPIDNPDDPRLKRGVCMTPVVVYKKPKPVPDRDADGNYVPPPIIETREEVGRSEIRVEFRWK